MHNRRTFTAAAACVAAVIAGGSLTAAAAPSLSTAISSPHSDALYPGYGSGTIDALHYGLDLHWNADARWLAGVADIRFRAPRAESHVQLDMAWPLRMISASLDGAPVHTTHVGDHLTVATGSLAGTAGTACTSSTAVILSRWRCR